MDKIIMIPLNVDVATEPDTCSLQRVDNPPYTLGDRDKAILKIEKQIEEKKNMLYSRQYFLHNTVKDNDYLEGIKKDYAKYNTYIVKQKNEQIKAMELLRQYIEDIKLSGKLTEEAIVETKREQQGIVNEIDKIKKSMDKIISI